jgi:AraC-like DNA-binding protein
MFSAVTETRSCLVYGVLRAVRRMWHRADTLANDPLLGLNVGRHQDYRAVGVLAPVIWHSPTVHDALENIATFQSVISEGGTFCILPSDAHGLRTQCEYVPSINMVPANPHQILALVVGLIGIISAISNNKTPALTLYLPPSLDANALAKHVCCEVLTREGNLAVDFSCDYLAQPIQGCDPHLYQLNLAYAQELLRSKRDSLALIDSIKMCVQQLGYASANIDQVERKLELHKRTLQRKLSEQGTSFRQLKEEVIKEHCIHLLVTQKLKLEWVAQQLGYSEPSAFHRAFKTWFGITPKQFIRQPHY